MRSLMHYADDASIDFRQVGGFRCGFALYVTFTRSAGKWGVDLNHEDVVEL